ncbi:MAG: Uma2 family endonuclease [Leptolyngbya sp.]|nr:Uma2 family endonuclease [Leptolyngbya sp.]
MLDLDLTQLPTSDDLPCSDDIPVDNEDQNWLPNLLLFVLEYLWKDRQDWFFAVEMGVYHATGVHPPVPVVPDGFLSLGVERRKGGRSRNSYVTWEENGMVPILALAISCRWGNRFGCPKWDWASGAAPSRPTPSIAKP